MVGIAYTMSILLAVNSAQLFWRTRKEGVLWENNKLLRHCGMLALASLAYFLWHHFMSVQELATSLVLDSQVLRAFLTITIEGSILFFIFIISALISYKIGLKSVRETIRKAFKKSV